MSLAKVCGQQSSKSAQPVAVLLLAAMVFNTWSVGFSRTVQGVLSSVVARRERGQYLSSFAFHGKHRVFSVLWLPAGSAASTCPRSPSTVSTAAVGF